ncbi:MAG: DMT family transporter [bacterium]|nr:DMT family transporter [bacterium]
MAGWIIALISGTLMSLQGVFNTEVTKQTSIWLSAGWVQLTAFLTCVVFWLFGDRQTVSLLFAVRPWYLLAGGLMGAFITWTVIKSMAALKPAQATLIIVVAQIVVSYLVELMGLFGVDKAEFQWKKVLGAAVAVLGIFIFK